MTKIKIVTYGNVKHRLDIDSIIRWKSRLFTIIPDINEYNIGVKSDIGSWGFSDRCLRLNLPSIESIMVGDSLSQDADLYVYVTNVPLEDNYFSRIIAPNRIVLSIFQVQDILRRADIPLENFIIAMLYDYSLMFTASGRSLSMEYENELAHNDANGCIFNNCGHKEEIIDTCLKPHLCDICKSHFLQNSVPADQISGINSELRRLDRPIYYRLKHFIKERPVMALLLSAFTTILLSIIAGLILEKLLH